jgi:hypothetical protein
LPENSTKDIYKQKHLRIEWIKFIKCKICKDRTFWKYSFLVVNSTKYLIQFSKPGENCAIRECKNDVNNLQSFLVFPSLTLKIPLIIVALKTIDFEIYNKEKNHCFKKKKSGHMNL